MDKKHCLKRELQSLVGKLQHACKVVRLGRSFLHRMFNLLKGTAKKHHFILLNAAFRVFGKLEWHFHAAGSGIAGPTSSSCHRHIWGNREWGIVGEVMVVVAVARRLLVAVKELG